MQILEAGVGVLALAVAVGGPLLFLLAVIDDLFGIRDRYHEWADDRDLEASWRQHERNRLRPFARDGGWAAPNASTQRLEGARFWRRNWGEGRPLLVVQEDGVFDRYWCIYEMHELAPSLIGALPVSEYRQAEELFGEGAVQPSSPWVPKSGAVHYPWQPVPAYVNRSLSATAAWVDRQGPGLLSL